MKTFFIITNKLKSAESSQHQWLPAGPLLSTGQLPPSYGWEKLGIFPSKSSLDCSLPHRSFMGFFLPPFKRRIFLVFWRDNQFTSLFRKTQLSLMSHCHPWGRNTQESKLSACMSCFDKEKMWALGSTARMLEYLNRCLQAGQWFGAELQKPTGPCVVGFLGTWR